MIEVTAALLPVGLWGQLWIWILQLVVTVGPSSALTEISREAGLHNVSQTIEDLLEGYDIRLRPQFGGEACKNNKLNRPGQINHPLNIVTRNSAVSVHSYGMCICCP